MDTLIVCVFVENRHPVHNPAEREEAKSNDGDGHNKLHPAREVAYFSVPVEGNQGDVNPINDNTDNGENACESNNGSAFPLNSPGVKEAGEEDEEKNFNEEPIA